MNGGMEAKLKHQLGEEAKAMGGLATLSRNRRMPIDVKGWNARNLRGTYNIVLTRVEGDECKRRKEGASI